MHKTSQPLAHELAPQWAVDLFVCRGWWYCTAVGGGLGIWVKGSRGVSFIVKLRVLAQIGIALRGSFIVGRLDLQ